MMLNFNDKHIRLTSASKTELRKGDEMPTKITSNFFRVVIMFKGERREEYFMSAKYTGHRRGEEMPVKM